MSFQTRPHMGGFNLRDSQVKFRASCRSPRTVTWAFKSMFFYEKESLFLSLSILFISTLTYPHPFYKTLYHYCCSCLLVDIRGFLFLTVFPLWDGTGLFEFIELCAVSQWLLPCGRNCWAEHVFVDNQLICPQVFK